MAQRKKRKNPSQLLRLPKKGKREIRAQFAALCYRVRKDKVQVLLVTGRKSGAWILPKGWPVDGATGSKSARNEAWEEAGVKGQITGDCLGVYIHYPQRSAFRRPRMVAVYPLQVAKLASEYPEAHLRRRKWFTAEKAARKVDNPALANLITGFTPPHLRVRPS